MIPWINNNCFFRVRLESFSFLSFIAFKAAWVNKPNIENLVEEEKSNFHPAIQKETPGC